MFIGFTGRAWEMEHEASVVPGQQHVIGNYTLTYRGPRMEVDPGKRMIFADLDVEKNGRPFRRISPARFIYTKQGQPTTEVAMVEGLKDDLYVVVGTIDPQSKRATLRFHVNPLVTWIWTGVFVLLFGASVSLWPEVVLREAGAWGVVRALAGTATTVIFSVLLAVTAAYGPGHASRAPPTAMAVLHDSAASPARP
jgi:cytochrome c-type biogenesis protein CcmF